MFSGDNDFTNLNFLSFYPTLWKFCEQLQEVLYRDTTFQELIKNDNLNFDLLIMEPYFAHESLVAFGHKLNVPVVGIYPLPLSAWPYYLLGDQPILPGNPHYLLPYTKEMSLFQRAHSVLLNIVELASGVLVNLPNQVLSISL